jgi:hypothetical protein
MNAPADVEGAIEATMAHVRRELVQVARTLEEIKLLLQLVGSALEASK